MLQYIKQEQRNVFSPQESKLLEAGGETVCVELVVRVPDCTLVLNVFRECKAGFAFHFKAAAEGQTKDP